MPWLHPSGGLVYHLRAWRYGGTHWSAFHDRVHGWLSGWRPPESHLVLVGPSGGYALEGAFLQRFGQVTVLEPDPLARSILTRRFPRIPFRFAADPGLARADGFERLARCHPDAAFLFCNLLGQPLVGQGPDFQRQSWLSGLASALAECSWASWHDLASTQRQPDALSHLGMDGAEPLEKVLNRYWQGGELTIHDHECAGLAPDAPREYALWELRPGQYHLVEWLAFT